MGGDRSISTTECPRSKAPSIGWIVSIEYSIVNIPEGEYACRAGRRSRWSFEDDELYLLQRRDEREQNREGGGTDNPVPEGEAIFDRAQ